MSDAPIVSAMSESIDVSPTPTEEEVVAILAGVEALWPKPVIAVDPSPPRRSPWRFSGRWWSRPVPARRDRPFR
jgi:hypothetical protein